MIPAFLAPLAISSLNAYKDYMVKGSLIDYMKSTTILNTLAMLHIMKAILIIIPLVLIPGALKLLGVELSAIVANPTQYKTLLTSLAVVCAAEILVAWPFFYGARQSGLYVLVFMGTVVYLTLTTLLSVFILKEPINKTIIIGLAVCFIGIFIVIHGASNK
jgi:drug/metabolite transporter (DMT)-like permease